MLNEWHENPLREVFETYTDLWPELSLIYRTWKPISVLPATKDDIKSSMKLAFKSIVDVPTWDVFSSFFMQFVDLGRFIPDDDFCVIDDLRQKSLKGYDPFMTCYDPLEWTRSEDDLLQLMREVRNEWVRTDTKQKSDVAASWIWTPESIGENDIDQAYSAIVVSLRESIVLRSGWLSFIVSEGLEEYLPNQ